MIDFSKWAEGIGGGAAIPLIGGSLFDDPSRDARKYLDQIPGMMKPYYEPYIGAGHNALSLLQGQYGQLLSDPGSLLARLGKGYQSSPGFEFEKNQGLSGIENAAAAGGMLGTMGHQQQAGQLATNLANKDYGDYMKEALGLYGKGLEGEEGINTMGYNASNELAQSLAAALMGQGNLAYEGGANKNKMWSDLLSQGGSMASKFIF